MSRPVLNTVNMIDCNNQNYTQYHIMALFLIFKRRDLLTKAPPPHKKWGDAPVNLHKTLI